MRTKKSCRYPGSRAFNDSYIDRKLFFGREGEKKALLHKILAKNLVVLFAKSGVGKTSLINAGLNPLLRERGFIPLRIGFYKEKSDNLLGIYEGIRETIQQNNIDCDPGKEDTLWQYFKTVSFWSPNDTLFYPVLILDQFEAFFSIRLSPARETFIEQLTDLVKGTIPKNVRESYEAGKPLPYSEKRPKIKILISIREDFLGQLSELSGEIPAILHHLFYLKALNREQTRDAIIKPSQLHDDRIETPCFNYDSKALEAIIDFVSKRKERNGVIIGSEAKSLQLQLLCRHFESKISERICRDEADNILREDDLGGESGMQQILQNYYGNGDAH